LLVGYINYLHLSYEEARFVASAEATPVDALAGMRITQGFDSLASTK